MKTTLSSSSFRGLLLAAALGGTFAQASPIPIVGSISFLGNATINTSSLANASSFTTFTADAVNQVSGAYVTIPTLVNDPVTFTPFTFYTGGGTSAMGALFSATPVAAPLTTNPLWTFTSVAGVTYSFAATGTIDVDQNSLFLDVSGQGLEMITGGIISYAPTVGTWTIEETNTGTSFSFGASSGSAAPVADRGSTWVLMALGLVAVVVGHGFRRKSEPTPLALA